MCVHLMEEEQEHPPHSHDMTCLWLKHNIVHPNGNNAGKMVCAAFEPLSNFSGVSPLTSITGRGITLRQTAFV